MALFYGGGVWITITQPFTRANPTKQPMQVLLRGIISSAESILFEATVDVAVHGFTLKMAPGLERLPILVVYPSAKKTLSGRVPGGVKAEPVSMQFI
jgi:hypothetical protein